MTVVLTTRRTRGEKVSPGVLPSGEDARQQGARVRQQGARAQDVAAPAAVHEAVEDVASAAFFRAHYPRLAGWCRRLVDDDETAHDIASEAFVRLIAKQRTLDDARGYLYTIAVNLVRDHWRRTQRERRGLRQILAARPEQTLPAPGGDTELRMLVQSLPDKLRAPVLLHYFADLPVDAVARSLGRKPGTVKSQLFDARALLRSALGNPDHQDQP